MKLSIGELLHGRSGWSTIFSKSHKKPTQHCEVGQISRSLERNSVELHKTRLQTRRCSLENSGLLPAAACEELHCVMPRQDSITLAKLRLSHAHETDATADTAAPADFSTHGSDASSSWHITAEEAAATA